MVQRQDRPGPERRRAKQHRHRRRTRVSDRAEVRRKSGRYRVSSAGRCSSSETPFLLQRRPDETRGYIVVYCRQAGCQFNYPLFMHFSEKGLTKTQKCANLRSLYLSQSDIPEPVGSSLCENREKAMTGTVSSEECRYCLHSFGRPHHADCPIAVGSKVSMAAWQYGHEEGSRGREYLPHEMRNFHPSRKLGLDAGQIERDRLIRYSGEGDILP